MKRNRSEAGFSLVETMVAIAILAILVVPICTGLVLSVRLNEKAEQMMQAELAVSSAVETLMAEGITDASSTYDGVGASDRFPDVKVVTSLDQTAPYYNVVVTDNEKLVSVAVTIRAKGGSQ